MFNRNLVGAMLALAVAAPVMAQGKSGKSAAAKGHGHAGAQASSRVDQRRDDRDDREERDVLGQRADAEKRAKRDHIPPGQLPPAGMCRIWIDGVPPGQQPAPTDCQTAIARRPANARVIFGDQTPFPGKGKDKSAKKTDDRNDGGIWGIAREADDDDDPLAAARRRAQTAASKVKGKGGE